MNTTLIGNDGTGLNVWQGGEDKLQQMHGRGIVSVMDHGWSDIWEEILFDGKLVEPGEKSECLLIGHAGDKFHGAQVKTSTVYVISEADAITDSAAIKNYGAKVPETLAPFSGHYHFVVRGGKAENLDGDPPPEGIVVIAFDSSEQAHAWYDSPAYAAIRPIRQAAIKGRMFIVEGVAP